MHDITIVGYGPAGITAALYAARKKLRVLLIGELPGGEVRNSGEIENWPGDGHTDGLVLSDKLIKHLELHKDDVTIKQEPVTKIIKDGAHFVTITATGSFPSKTVIYTAGRHPRLLNVPGEVDYKNRGVTYCAVCDAPLFSQQTVAVIGGGDTGAEAVIILQKIAQKIYLLQVGDALKADPILVNNFKNDPKVEIVYNAKTTRIAGEAMVSSLTYQDQTTQENKTLSVSGIFVAIGAIPNTAPVKDLLVLDTLGAIPADRYGKTSLPGFFAAGDVTDVRDAQIVVAAGHGCSAALSAGDYLSRMPHAVVT